MGTARARVEVPGPVGQAEALWYDVGRWPSFVEGFSHVARQDGGWPQAGGRLTWDSGRAGRGRVVERVVAYESGAGQTAEVEDPKLWGTQRVAFRAGEGAGQPGLVEVSLELEYALKSPAGIAGRVVDLLFVRRAVTDSLRRTLVRFARELEAERDATL